MVEDIKARIFQLRKPSPCLFHIFISSFAVLLRMVVSNLVLVYFYNLFSEKYYVPEQNMTSTFFVNGLFGLVMSLFSTQPLALVGLSGPIYIYEYLVKKAVAKIADSKPQEIYFQFRMFSSLITFVLMFLATMFDWNSIAEHISHFTVEIFEVENGVVYVMLSIKALLEVEGVESQMKTVILMCIAFMMSFGFNQIENSQQFTRFVKSIARTLGIVITAGALLALDGVMFPGIKSEVMLENNISIKDLNLVYKESSIYDFGKLFTHPRSGLLITASFAYAFGQTALLLAETLIVDQSIIEIHDRIGDKNTIQSNFSINIFLVSIFQLTSAFLEVPIFSPVSYQSNRYSHSITSYSAQEDDPMGPKIPTQLPINRFALFLIYTLITLVAVLNAPIGNISIGILIGLMAFFGIETITSVTLFDRILLLIVPKKRHPARPYVTEVRTRCMHVYSLIQVAAVAIVLGCEEIPHIAPLFGVVTVLTLLLPPYVMRKLCFTHSELLALGGKHN